jgi:hypothetical protein
LNLDIISTYPDIKTPTKRNLKPKSKLSVQKYFTNSTVEGDSGGEETPQQHKNKKSGLDSDIKVAVKV